MLNELSISLPVSPPWHLTTRGYLIDSNKPNSNSKTGICRYEDRELAAGPSPKAVDGCTTGDSSQPTAIVSIAVTQLGFMEASGDDCNSSCGVFETAHALQPCSTLNTASDCPSVAVTAMESSAGAVPVTSPSMTLTGLLTLSRTVCIRPCRRLRMTPRVRV